MLDVNDWNMWLGSSETRTAIAVLKETLAEVEGSVVDGYMLQHESADRIAVDYAHKVGVVEGLRKAIQNLLDIAELVNNGESNDNQ